MSAEPSKRQCGNSEIFPPLLSDLKVDQNILFQETCFAFTIFEPEFMVWSSKFCFRFKVNDKIFNFDLQPWLKTTKINFFNQSDVIKNKLELGYTTSEVFLVIRSDSRNRKLGSRQVDFFYSSFSWSPSISWWNVELTAHLRT